ncbi:hypothetical protein DPMN_048321 [Dreissena polymorpha]|uniref:Secreted protein n=1 Tax=Dreissena polymorpha TaxID=45954 RepID=A0A9D4I3W1_DREPO|nr:hypothetical protein DPMN_048321 [Dreissena polymorpha]
MDQLFLNLLSVAIAILERTSAVQVPSLDSYSQVHEAGNFFQPRAVQVDVCTGIGRDVQHHIDFSVVTSIPYVPSLSYSLLVKS